MDYMKDNKEISAEEAVILWQASRLSLSKSYEKAPEILKVHGSVIGTLGNFSASIGKAKSKKTFNVSAIVAAALKNGTVLRYVAELPEDKRKILYVDTEQSPYHCLKVMKRILRMNKFNSYKTSIGRNSLQCFLIRFLLNLSIASLLSLVTPITAALYTTGINLFKMKQIFSAYNSCSMCSLKTVKIKIKSFAGLSKSVFALFMVEKGFERL